MWDDVKDCFIHDAQCVRINKYCICHCMLGYSLEDGKCLKSNIAFSLNNDNMQYRARNGLLYLKKMLNITRKQTYIWCGELNAKIYSNSGFSC